MTTVPNNARHNRHIWVAKDLLFQKSSKDIVFAFFINLNSIFFKLVNKGTEKQAKSQILFQKRRAKRRILLEGLWLQAKTWHNLLLRSWHLIMSPCLFQHECKDMKKACWKYCSFTVN